MVRAVPACIQALCPFRFSPSSARGGGRDRQRRRQRRRRGRRHRLGTDASAYDGSIYTSAYITSGSHASAYLSVMTDNASAYLRAYQGTPPPGATAIFLAAAHRAVTWREAPAAAGGPPASAPCGAAQPTAAFIAAAQPMAARTESASPSGRSPTAMLHSPPRHQVVLHSPPGHQVVLHSQPLRRNP